MKQIQLSESANIGIYDDGNVVIQNRTRVHLSGDEAAALTRYLVADTLKELEGEVLVYEKSVKDESFAGAGEFGAGENMGKRVALDKTLSLIRAKLKGGEDGAK